MPKSVKIFLVVTSCVVLFALVMLGIRCNEAFVDPVVTIPNPTMPRPNAYDILQQATNTLSNANKLHTKKIEFLGPGSPQLLTGKLQWENAQAQVLIHKAFAYQYLDPPVRTTESYVTSFEEGNFFDLRHLCEIEARVKSNAGDWDGAVNDYLDALQIGVMQIHGAILDQVTGGMEHQRLACLFIAARHCIEHLKRTEAEAACTRLEKILENQVTMADAYREEKWAREAMLLEYFHQHTRSIIYVFRTKRERMHDLESKMDTAIAKSAQPYQTVKNYPFPLSLNVFYAYFVRPKPIFDYTHTQTDDALLLTALALRAYCCDHGTYPDSLAALTPKYLKVVPADPFAINRPLQYRRESGSKYCLYSVGPDGVDDGGKPIYNTKKKSHVPTPDSKGDIVFGVNL